MKSLVQNQFLTHNNINKPSITQSLLRLGQLLFLLPLAMVSWASQDYKSTLTVSVKTGAGTVYVGKSTSYEGGNSTNSTGKAYTQTTNGTSAATHTFCINAVPATDYRFSGWTFGGTWATQPSSSTAATSGTMSSGTTAVTATAQASFVLISIASVSPTTVTLTPTDARTSCSDYTGSVVFTTSNDNAVSQIGTPTFTNTGSGTWTATNSWAKGTSTVTYTFKGNGYYGGSSTNSGSRNNSATLTLPTAGGTSSKSVTFTANFPSLVLSDAAENNTAYPINPTSDGTGTVVFPVQYCDGAFDFTATITGASGGTFTPGTISFTQTDAATGSGNITVPFTFNAGGATGDFSATLTLTPQTNTGGTAKSVTITAYAEAEATNDVSVTTSAGVETEYATFAAGLTAANASAGCTLKLLRNIDLGTITATNNISKAMTIDLNGKELRAAVNAKQVGVLTVNANVVVTIKDSKTGGRIINEHGMNAVLYTINVAQGTLNLESGTISIHNTLQQSYGTAAAGGVATSVVSMGARAIQQAAATTVNIKGGRVESYGTRAVYGIRTEGSKANNTTLNISGGEVYAEAPAYAYAVFSNGKLNVSGGTITAKINNDVVNENTAYMEYIRTNNKLWDNRTYGLRGFGYGILLQGGNSVTAKNNYFGTLNMTGGTVNVINVGDPEMQAKSTATDFIQSPLYGVYFNAAALNVKTGTASDGSYSQKYAAKGSITGGTISVTNSGRQSYGVYVMGHYNSFDNTSAPVVVKNCTINVSSSYESYGVYANAAIGTTTDNASPNMGACYAGEVELTGATVTAETTTAATAYALFAHAVVGNVYKNATWTKAKNAGYTQVYDGEYAAAAKITVNSGTYTATSATTTAYAVGSTTRAKTTLSSKTSVAAERELGGNAEAYPVLILHGGTFRGQTGTTTSGAVLSGGHTTIDGGTYTAYSGTTTSRGIYATAGTLDISGVEISASGTTTAYGIDLACGISDYTGFKYYADATLKNLTVTATTRTGGEADAVLMEVTKRPLSTTTYNALSSSNKTNYGAIYQYGEYAVGSKCTIIGGTYTATSATATAYGVRMNSAAICEDVNGDGELAISAAELIVKNATFTVKANNGKTAYGVWAGGPATIDNSKFTVNTSADEAWGVRARYGKTTISNSTINVTAGTATARGIYVDALMSAISTNNNTTHFCGVQGYEIKGEVELNNNTITAKANGGNTAYAVQVIGAKGAATQTTAEQGLAFAGDHAIAGEAVINGGTYTATASGTTAYAVIVSDPVLQGEATATPTCIINDGKFKGTATSTYADVSPNGETGYFVLNGGYYVLDENLDKKLGEGMNKVAVKSGTPEYAEGYRWRVTDNMTGEIVCKVYEGTTLKQSFQSLEEALAYVNLPDNSSKTQTIVMCANYTLSRGDYELPANKTLLVPYKSSGTGKGATQAIGSSPVWVNYDTKYISPTPLYKLTFASGVNLTVMNNAAIEASCVIYITNGASGQGATLLGNGTGIPHDKYGLIHLEEGSYIDLESGAKLFAWGYVTGKGEINAKNGSAVYEDFQMGDWRGGTVEVNIQGNKNGLNSKGVFPITHYYYQNIECPITYRAGSMAYALGGTAVNALGATNAVTNPAVQFIGTSGAMFLLDPATAGEDTWVRKEYDAETDYVNWTLSSGAKIGSVTLKMSALGLNINLNSSDYVLPITSNFNIIANYGDIEITNDVCFIPGSKLTIKKEANVIIPSGKNVFFYDQDDWKSYGGYWFNPGYSPSWKVNPRVATIGDKTKVKMPDAEVLVEGTLTLNGKTYTTAGGANIRSTRENSGKVIFGANAPASTAAIAEFTGKTGTTSTLCQITKAPDSTPTYEGKALNSAWLKNEDGSYAQTIGTAAGKIWIYMQDEEDGKYKWILSYDDGCFTYKNTGGGEHQLIHPSDWVAVQANANGDHAYHSEVGTRMFVNTEATTNSASCVWWEVYPTPEVIDGTTYYVANNDYFDNYGTYYYWDNSVSYWKPKKITVRWNDKDGNKITNGTFGDEYDFNISPVFHGTNPTWANSTTEKHDWIGWRDEEGNIYDKNATLPRATSDVTYTAYFNTTKYQYTITFKNDDNSDLWAGLVDAGTTGAELQALFETKYNEKTGNTVPQKAPTIDEVFTFKAWDKTLDIVTAAATYTASYTSETRKYTVTFLNYNAVDELYSAEVAYNTRPVYPDNTVRPFRANTSAYSYDWTGWQQGSNTYGISAALPVVTGNISYIATFAQTELKYQVFFKRQDGTIIDAPKFSYEETPAAFPANPTMASTVSTDYTFREWSPATLVPVTEDGKVYTALFNESPRKYTAHFVNYNATSLGADKTIDYNTVPTYTGTTPTKPNDARNSYEFAGWAWSAGEGWEAGSVGVGEALPAIKGEITFTAQFNAVLLQFNIIYQRENGTIIDSQKKKWGESTAFPTTFTGATSGLDYDDETYSYTFDHWSPAAVVTPVTADATYTAYYNQSIKTYSITAVGISPAGYGSVSPASLSGIPGGSTVTVDGNKLTVNGSTITATPAAADAQYTYTFDQWNNVPATITGNISTIEAVFTRTVNTYTVTWKNTDGTVLETDENVEYGTTPTYDGETPTKVADADGVYTHNGWTPTVVAVAGETTYTATYASVPSVASVTVNEVTTYYATIAEAITLANSKTNAVVTILQDAAVTSEIAITAAMTIDLNGKTVSSTLATATGVFKINASGKIVTINGAGGTISHTSNAGVFGLNVVAGTLNMTGGTVEVDGESGNPRGVYVKGSSGSTAIVNLTDVTVESNSSGNNSIAVYTYGYTDVTINSGTYRATASSSSARYAVFARNEAGSKITINGGKFNGTDKDVYKGGANATISISGGYYVHQNNIGDYCVANHYVFDLPSSETPYKYEVAEGYTLTFDANGHGTAPDAQVVKKGGNATEPTEPTAEGYTFGGWYKEVACTNAWDFSTDVVNAATTLYAKWTPNTNTMYVVNHYQQNIDDDGYTLVEGDVQHLTGTTDTEVTPAVKSYTGFISPSPQTVNIDGDGSRVVDYYYTRNSYTLTWVTDGDALTGTYTSGSVRFGKTIVAPNTPTKMGYTFNSWSPAPAETMPAEAQTYTAIWDANDMGDYMDIIDLDGTTLKINMNGYVGSKGLGDPYTAGTGTQRSAWTLRASKDANQTADYHHSDAKDNKMILDVDLTDLGALTAGQEITIAVYAHNGALDSYHTYTVPKVYNADATLSGTDAESIILVRSGKLSVNDNATVKDVYVYPGAELFIKAGVTLTINGQLVLRTEGTNDDKAMFANKSAVLTNNGNISCSKVFYSRISRNNLKAYQIGFPFDVDLTKVSMSSQSYNRRLGKSPFGSLFGVLYYDAASRAESGPEAGNWIGLDPSSETTMNAKQGYQIIAASGSYCEFYFPVSYIKPADDQPVAISAYAGDAEGLNSQGEKVLPGDKGWNYIVSPYTHEFTFNASANSDPAYDLKITELILWNGTSGEEVFQQYSARGAKIKPASPFYIQAPSAGTLSFSPSGSQFVANGSGPNGIIRRAPEGRILTQWLNIYYGSEQGDEDQTNIYTHPNKFSIDYEAGLDLAKYSKSGVTPKIYSTLACGDLAFTALPDSVASQRIPLTVYAPKADEMYFTMQGNDFIDRLESVLLFDTHTGAVTDLLFGDYYYYAEQGTQKGRFYLQPVFRAPKVATDADAQDESVALIHTDGNSITVSGLTDGAKVLCYDVVGHLIAQYNNAEQTVTLHVPATGVYFIQVGKQVTKVVIR